MTELSAPMSDDVWPEELRLRNGGKTLTVVFNNGEQHDLGAEYLRVESPSAEVQGHGPGQKVTVGGKSDVSVIKVEPVGNYAVRLTFASGRPNRDQTSIVTSLPSGTMTRRPWAWGRPLEMPAPAA